jgi:hypothetical protein
MFFSDKGFHFFICVIELIKRSGIDNADGSESGWFVYFLKCFLLSWLFNLWYILELK